MRYFLHLNYAGARYHGWQFQPGHATIQETLEKQMSKLLNGQVAVTGCGRTDSGVHAHSYYAHFDWNGELPKSFLLRLNKMLPEDIAVLDIFNVHPDAHARYDAIDRTYRYFIHFKKNAFLSGRSYWLHSYKFDMEKMNSAASILCRYSDFSTFEKKGADNTSSDCILYEAGWQVLDANQWCFTIRSNRFLRNMVRRITGALLMAGSGSLGLDELESAVSQKDGLEVTFAPPARGLFLWEVTYPKTIFMDLEQD